VCLLSFSTILYFGNWKCWRGQLGELCILNKPVKHRSWVRIGNPKHWNCIISEHWMAIGYCFISDSKLIFWNDAIFDNHSILWKDAISDSKLIFWNDAIFDNYSGSFQNIEWLSDVASFQSIECLSNIASFTNIERLLDIALFQYLITNQYSEMMQFPKTTLKWCDIR
jgi:hypothetical protein